VRQRSIESNKSADAEYNGQEPRPLRGMHREVIKLIATSPVAETGSAFDELAPQRAIGHVGNIPYRSITQ
jgi:hypothetical protein